MFLVSTQQLKSHQDLGISKEGPGDVEYRVCSDSQSLLTWPITKRRNHTDTGTHFFFLFIFNINMPSQLSSLWLY